MYEGVTVLCLLARLLFLLLRMKAHVVMIPPSGSTGTGKPPSKQVP
jgi:hypothetical protein